MKRILLLSLLALSCILGAMAQKHGERPKKEMFREMKEFKLKFLAQELKLEGEQCDKFFEVYSAEMDEIHNVWLPAIKLRRQVCDNPKATEQDYEALTDATNRAKAEQAKIEAKYDKKLSEVLSSKQIYELREAEERFRDKMKSMRKDEHGHKKKMK